LTLPALALALLATGAPVVDRVAATVDGEVVTLSDLKERAGPDWARVERMSEGKERDEVTRETLKRALDAIIAERLLLSAAKTLQLEVTDAQVDAAVNDIKTRNHFDDAQFEEALSSQGLDRATFRAQIRRELETYQVLQHNARGRVKVSDDDVRNYYRTHPQEFGGEVELKVRHIFLPVREGATKADEEKVRAQGEKVLQRLKTGEDFAKVAKEVSKGPSAADGGDLGWLRRGTIQKQLEDAAFQLKDGELSPLVRAGPGFHLLKVEGRRTGGGRTYEEAAEEIRLRLFDEQASASRAQYLEQLKKDAHVDVKIPELKG
jgi:peptidyl-prolyl cis-trans isomerase SurA